MFVCGGFFPLRRSGWLLFFPYHFMRRCAAAWAAVVLEGLQERVRDLAPVPVSAPDFALVPGSALDFALALPAAQGRLLLPRDQEDSASFLRRGPASVFVVSLHRTGVSRVFRTGGLGSVASITGSTTDFSSLTALTVSRHSSHHSSSAAGSF